MADMADAVLVIDRAFRGADAIDGATCDMGRFLDGRTDVDCSGATDVVDVVNIIAVGFRGAVAHENFCAPCEEIP
jgi:hypothetical protein